MRSKFWLLIDGCIAAPFWMLGYVLSVGNRAIRTGWTAYEYNYQRAKEGKL
jgi:hypothetical protein